MASIQYARDRKHTKTLGDFIVEAVYTNDKFSDAKLEVKFINGTFVSIPDGCKEFIVTSQGVSHPLAPLPGVEHSDEGIVPIEPIEPIEHDDTTSDDDEANDNSELPQTDVLVRSIGAVEVVQYYDESSFEVAGNIKQPSREDLRGECIRRSIVVESHGSTNRSDYIDVLKNQPADIDQVELAHLSRTLDGMLSEAESVIRTEIGEYNGKHRDSRTEIDIDWEQRNNSYSQHYMDEKQFC